jgi:chromosomal replication initiation ATPase DnaA
MTGEALWAEVDARLRAKVGAPSYKLWLKELVVVGFDGTTLDIGVSNALYRSFLMKRFGDVLLDALAETGHDVGVNLVLLPKPELPPVSYEPSIPLVRSPSP